MQGISVIIPCYNREHLLREAIESVLAQEYGGPVEIVVADDGSSDRSVEIAESFGPPVKVLRKPADCTEQGPGPARNRAIAASSHPFLAFLDSDDIFLPGHLQRLASALESEPDVGMVFDEAKTICNGRMIVFPYPACLMQSPDAHGMLLEPLPQTDSIMVRRSLLHDPDAPFDPELLFCEDNDLRIRIAERHPVRFVKGFGSAIREHENRSINTSRREKLFHYDMLMLKKATARYDYARHIVRAKKAKLYYFRAIGRYRESDLLNFLRYFVAGFATSPGIYLQKFKEKVFKA
ncbi:glycosyltransferase family A protein [Desulfovibrio sp. X2]|uniref:glycosyltransferase family 2 protein n=1 Tax=Desulfovibrio sp. X2 TaxID=941449 RepID=UPI00054D7492|nr:glycosyltransferase family A protein [Desulfovibrio sp. X2]